ncbi:peptidase M24 [Methanomicrobiaceae archaeon CYW5]|uniref:M24 family metallopeptidase n=1 Tax=Methanovulcanius yangii TaxID=1789227 RepID=UPI0029CA81CC|nr:Xaa-Pro peptidase family protein [Methanovulcanius yangii]MBT8508745.1 peptidase M24 [Methanovulcanius yangii]
MQGRVPQSELLSRMTRFRTAMDRADPAWKLAAVVSKVNLYYFTGTMQDGLLLIPRDGGAVFWVRKSLERARAESRFGDIRPMGSFRDAAAATSVPATVHMETEVVTLAFLDRFKKHFPCTSVRPADGAIAAIRAVKSAYELSLMEEAGRIHRHVLERRVPELLVGGISEAAFTSSLYPLLVEEGHHGTVRFGMFDTEMLLGQVGFGESSLYPTCFDGPGGSYGMCAAVPLLGSRERTLQKGDLVFVDVGCGVDGYHTDKTMTYVYCGELPEEAVAAHAACVEIQDQIAAMLRPGISPAEIYATVMDGLDTAFLENFMGYGGRRVKFLGHSIGLQIDELPVIARGFAEPLQENMTFALEPKKGIPGVGMVGIENTFVVTPHGGRCLTGTHPGLMPVCRD